VRACNRLRVGVIFGLFEGGMPILGLLLGRSLANTLGHAARWIGAALLVATGLYAIVQATRSSRQQARPSPKRLASGPGGCWSPGRR
jgi:putative Mn2+ efflux pump MntP